MGSPYDSPSLVGTGRAYHVPHTRLDGEGSAYPPVAVVAARGEASAPLPIHSAFWRKPVSIFGLFVPNDV